MLGMQPDLCSDDPVIREKFGGCNMFMEDMEWNQEIRDKMNAAIHQAFEENGIIIPKDADLRLTGYDIRELENRDGKFYTPDGEDLWEVLKDKYDKLAAEGNADVSTLMRYETAYRRVATAGWERKMPRLLRKNTTHPLTAWIVGTDIERELFFVIVYGTIFIVTEGEIKNKIILLKCFRRLAMKKLLLILLFAFSALGICGCSQKEYCNNVEEKKQFIQVITASDDIIGIIDDNKEIEKFVKQLDIESWNYMEQLPEDIDLVYSYISYEVIDEPIFLQDGKQLVNKSTLEFYISSKGEYIIRDYNQEIETIARISEKAGQFLNAPEDLDLNKNITAKDILDGWGLDFYVPNSDIEKTDDIENARYYKGNTSFTEEELLKTSKKQKIQFYGADKSMLLNEIDDISEITQYLNGLALNQWEYVGNVPNHKEVECQIVRFMLSRDNKKELKEMYTQILYKSNGNYYIEEIIPGEYSDRGEFITHYQVSEEIAKYILSYLE